MTTLKRTLILLVFALAVSGIAYALVDTGTLSAGGDFEGGRPALEGGRPEGEGGTGERGSRGNHDHGEDAGAIGGIAAIGKSLIIITAISAAVWLISRIAAFFKKNRQKKPAPA